MGWRGGVMRSLLALLALDVMKGGRWGGGVRRRAAAWTPEITADCRREENHFKFGCSTMIGCWDWGECNRLTGSLWWADYKQLRSECIPVFLKELHMCFFQYTWVSVRASIHIFCASIERILICISWVLSSHPLQTLTSPWKPLIAPHVAVRC